jgi:hypothetical protein
MRAERAIITQCGGARHHVEVSSAADHDEERQIADYLFLASGLGAGIPRWCLGLVAPPSPVTALAAGSGGPASDEPDGEGEQQRRECEQPAGLDPLEGPEPACRLVAGELGVAVLRCALREGLQ